MTARGLITTGTMRISLPGYDVNSADIDQTCFDSRWSGVTPYLKGTLSSANNVPATVGFGENLASPPMFYGYFQNINGGGTPLSVFGNTMTMLRGGGTNNWWYVEVSVNAILFQVQFGSQAATLHFVLFKKVAL
jgi:hypothetical protein